MYYMMVLAMLFLPYGWYQVKISVWDNLEAVVDMGYFKLRTGIRIQKPCNFLTTNLDLGYLPKWSQVKHSRWFLELMSLCPYSNQGVFWKEHEVYETGP